jgi:hypothetical protein
MIFVQRGLAPMPAVEKAIARQVLHGGDLTTNVFEVCLVDEAKLAVALAETFGLPAAPAGKLQTPEPSVLGRVPGELALQHGIFPLAASDHALTIATSEPLSAAAEGNLASVAGMEIRQVLAPVIRIRQAIANSYGLPLERRFARLLAKIEGRPDPDPSHLPVAGPRVEPPSPLAVVAPAPAPPSPSPPPDVVPDAAAAEPAVELPAAPEVAVAAPPPEAAAEPAVELESVPDVPPMHEDQTAARDQHAAATSPSDPPPPAAGARVLAGWLRRTTGQERKGSRAATHGASSASSSESPASDVSDATALEEKPSAPVQSPGRSVRRKGPFTAAMAEQDLAQAASADEVLGIVFAFAQQYFDYSALFVVHGDVAQGSDASGPGAARAALKAIAVPLRSASVFSRARELRAPIVELLDADAVDGELARQLQRRPLASGELGRVAVIPIVVRTRVVALVYGDDGSAGVALAAIGDVIALVGMAGQAIERVILRKKRSEASPEQASGSGKGVSPADSTDPAGLGARRPLQAGAGLVTLARMFGTQGEAGEPGKAPEPAAELEGAEKSGSNDRIEHEEEPPASSAESNGAAARDKAEGPSSASARRAPPRSRRSEHLPGERARPTTAHRRGVAPSFGRRSKSSPLVSSPLPVDPPPNATHASVDPSESASVPVARRSPAAPATGVQHALLVQYVIDGGAMFDDAFAELVRGGEASMPAAIAKFPGPVQVDRHRARDIPRASQCGPLLALIARIGRPAIPFLTLRATAGDVEARFWVTHLFGELCYPEAANALVPSLFDDDGSVRRIARRSAASLGLAGATAAPIVQALEEVIKNRDERTARRVMAIEAIADIRTTSIIPELIRAVRDSSEQVVSAARRALVVITGQDMGREALQWSDWWANNAQRHRIEWLIDALVHEQPSIRRVAGEELKQITKENFGFYDDLSQEEREEVQRRARQWWEREGRTRFE